MLKNNKILKIFTVLAVMIVSICMLTGCEKKESGKENKVEQEAFEEPIKNLVEGLGEANSQKLLSAFPSFISDIMKDIFTDEQLKGVIDETKTEYGDNMKMTYSITNKEEISEEDLKTMQDDVKTTYNQEITITKGYSVEAKITTKGDNKEDVEDENFKVYEIDGKWYLLEL